eukprot:TRINITY_DN2791_c0_g1_i5.p1 TRINITY_DN2791_c0_g1~~TRINITY_DN2791_c0_g1_i5.p1  ORF type:complete len:651 (+),score=88.62 TRINITY_DN2791_c0_g1_i5:82-2034(+)
MDQHQTKPRYGGQVNTPEDSILKFRPKFLGQQLNDVRKIGSGEFATVYSATYIADGNEIKVAVKKIHNLNKKSFLRELAALRTLRHPNLIKLLEFPTNRDEFYLVFEFADQGDLGSYISTKPRPRFQDLLRLGADVGRGVLYLHQNNFLHLDLHLGNILLKIGANGVLTAVVGDLGIAREKETPVQYTEGFLGTMAYSAVGTESSPSSNTRKMDHRTDINHYKRILQHLFFWKTKINFVALTEFHQEQPDQLQWLYKLTAPHHDYVSVRFLLHELEILREGAKVQNILHLKHLFSTADEVTLMQKLWTLPANLRDDDRCVQELLSAMISPRRSFDVKQAALHQLTMADIDKVRILDIWKDLSKDKKLSNEDARNILEYCYIKLSFDSIGKILLNTTRRQNSKNDPPLAKLLNIISILAPDAAGQAINVYLIGKIRGDLAKPDFSLRRLIDHWFSVTGLAPLADAILRTEDQHMSFSLVLRLLIEKVFAGTANEFIPQVVEIIMKEMRRDHLDPKAESFCVYMTSFLVLCCSEQPQVLPFLKEMIHKVTRPLIRKAFVRGLHHVEVTPSDQTEIAQIFGKFACNENEDIRVRKEAVVGLAKFFVDSSGEAQDAAMLALKLIDESHPIGDFKDFISNTLVELELDRNPAWNS